MLNRRRNLFTFACVIGVSTTLLAQAKEARSELEAARNAVVDARRNHADASAAVSKAEVTRMRLEKSVRAEFQNKPDLLEAKRYAGEATRYYNALRDAVRKELALEAGYQSLLAELRDAERALAQANSAEGTPLSQKLAMMHDVMAARAELTRYEAAAFALDPAIEDARVAMNAAHDAANKLERAYRSQANGDPRLAAAEDEIVHAKQQLSESRTALADAAKKLEAAEKREAIRTAGRRSDAPPIRRQEP